MPIREAPKGTLVKFEVETNSSKGVPEDLQGVQLRLEEDLAISLSSEFSEVF